MIVDISIAHEKQGGAVWCVSVRMVVGVGAGSDILVFGGLLGWWAVWDTDDWVMWVWACGCEMVKKTTQMLLEYYDAARGYMILMHDGGYKSWWGQRILLLLGTTTAAIHVIFFMIFMMLLQHAMHADDGWCMRMVQHGGLLLSFLFCLYLRVCWWWWWWCVVVRGAASVAVVGVVFKYNSWSWAGCWLKD